MTMFWRDISEARPTTNMRADIWVQSEDHGYRIENCLWAKPFGRDGREAWINMNGAPIENSTRKVTHFLIVEGPGK